MEEDQADVRSKGMESTPIMRNLMVEWKCLPQVGIVGRTGSGKTSLLRVLFRMYPYAGSIKLDGVDIATMPAGFLRSRLAVIPQAISFLLRSPHGRCTLFYVFAPYCASNSRWDE